MKWRWPWTSPPPPPVMSPPPPDDPRVIHAAQKLNDGLSKLEEQVQILGKGQSMTMMLDEALRVMKK